MADKRFKKVSDGKIEQNKYIKSIIFNAFKESEKSINQVLEEINNQSEFEISYGTLYDILQTDDPKNNEKTINLYAIIALCRYFHLDYAYVLAKPDSGIQPFRSSNINNEAKFTPLNNAYYCGKFHGYFMSQNDFSDKMIKFTLEVSSHSGKAAACFTYDAQTRLPSGEVETSHTELYGTPVLCTETSNIFISLTNDRGEFIFLYYNKRHLSTHFLEYQRGVILTASTVGNNEPLQSTFVMFYHDIMPDDEVYVRGLLAGPQSNLFISENDLKELCQQYDLVDDFYQKHKYIFDTKSNTIIHINSQQILANSTNNSRDNNEAAKVLLLLSTKSLIPNRTKYSESELINRLCRDIVSKALDNDSFFSWRFDLSKWWTE